MKVKLRKIYFLFLFILGLFIYTTYSTYAFFEGKIVLDNVIDFNLGTLSLSCNMNEYEQIRIAANSTKLLEFNLSNKTSEKLNYLAWYEIVNSTLKKDFIDIGIFEGSPASGSINSNGNNKLVVGISNYNNSNLILNIGVESKKGSINLPSNKYKINSSFKKPVTVTNNLIELSEIYENKEINHVFDKVQTYEILLGKGNYKLETWGAQGGGFNNNGGKGGYSVGNLVLNKKSKLYINVGGTTIDNLGGFNGGGNAANYSKNDAYGGGGATDIRINENDLYSRVIVAGGGGGSSATTILGGVGGGIDGGVGKNGGTYLIPIKGGKGGSQTIGGKSNVPECSGIFGGAVSCDMSGGEGGGGGGGWYGGGHGTFGLYAGKSSHSAGGGGSGYVYTSSTAANYPQGCKLNNEYYLNNASTLNGNINFSSTDGINTETGHSGDGDAKISGIGDVLVGHSIPTIKNLNTLNIIRGTQLDLKNSIEYVCEKGKTDCYIYAVNINDISKLNVGNYIIKYAIYSPSTDTKYIYSRNLNIRNVSEADKTIQRLNLNLSTDTPLFTNTSCSNGCGDSTVGLYDYEDEEGVTFYFRGDVENNYVKFGTEIKDNVQKDIYWRIIRINGDGTIRMIYDGNEAHANGTKRSDGSIVVSTFNKTISDNAYEGYMYGTPKSTTYADTHANINDSTAKSKIDLWYESNILGKYDSYIADVIYCNDRSLFDGLGFGKKRSNYMASDRLVAKKEPSLKCNPNDSFSVKNGNNKYPVGLITADEVVLAGGKTENWNRQYYLYTGYWFWTMTPSYFNTIYASGFLVHEHGELSPNYGVGNSTGLRPVISLKKDSIKYGTGTMINPFTV